MLQEAALVTMETLDIQHHVPSRTQDTDIYPCLYIISTHTHPHPLTSCGKSILTSNSIVSISISFSYSNVCAHAQYTRAAMQCTQSVGLQEFCSVLAADQDT